MGTGWLTWLAGLAIGFSVGTLVGAYFTYRSHLQELLVARSDVERERTRADNALDALAQQIHGAPISVAAQARTQKSLEATLREREDLQEMLGDDDEEPDAASI